MRQAMGSGQSQSEGYPPDDGGTDVRIHSSLVTHTSLKVESEHRLEPPTHEPYREYG